MAALLVLLGLILIVPSLSLAPFTTKPSVFTSVHNYVRQPGPLWGNLKVPLPTNTWYTNLGMAGENTIAEYPYITRTYTQGISVCYPDVTVSPDGRHITSPWSDDFILTNSQLNGGKINSSDQMTVEYNWISQTNISMKSMRVPGSPYISLNVTGQTWNITSQASFVSINGKPISTDVVISGTQFEIVTTTQTWILYVLGGAANIFYFNPAPKVEWIMISIPFPYRSVFRIANVPTASAAKVLDSYKDVIPTKGSVDVKFTCSGSPCDGTKKAAETATIIFNWNPVDAYGNKTTLPLLMMALPHHVDSVQPNTVSMILDKVYTTSKGPLTGFVSSGSWSLIENLTSVDVGFFPPRPIDDDKLSVLITSLQNDIQNLQTLDVDTYGKGKFMAQLAQLVLVSKSVGREDLFTTALANLTNNLEPWMNRVTYRDTFLYDLTWGGMISANGWLNPDKDYGNSYYNDHHFHYGYFTYAASVLLKYNPNWKYKTHILDLIRDFANPSTQDPYFPVTRHKDWYNGHSWAQGLDISQDGKNQESTSESINAYYGVALYGDAVGSPYIANIGKLLLATEIRSTQKYWHMQPGGGVYPDQFAQNGMVGILWSDKADYQTFFGPRTEYIHCIQMIPFVPISEVVLQPMEWAEFEWGVLSLAYGTPGLQDEWKGYMAQAQAITQKENGWNVATLLSDRAFLHGSSRTSMYWWIATRPN
eukprot:TRINITY_DN7440_c0_g1_i1.p1 TRINITY_DN7440_c0_g1~~TRINITY_DN7440_c0_g1_i1.p1  ORF type:complete len:714 (+),score=65.55 TRINITY_DN7440_c0_g1_i1:26-2143(+)